MEPPSRVREGLRRSLKSSSDLHGPVAYRVRRCLRGERQEFSKEVSHLTKRQQGSQFGRKVLQFGRGRILISEHSREAVLARSHARTPPQAADAHADVTVYRPKSGLGVALRAERLSASRTRVNAGAMTLNLRCDHLFLQASQNCLALAYRQSHGGRRELLYTLNRGNFVLGGLARNHIRNQLQCPFHPNSLRHPTTLHALCRQCHDFQICCTVTVQRLPRFPRTPTFGLSPLGARAR